MASVPLKRVCFARDMKSDRGVWLLVWVMDAVRGKSRNVLVPLECKSCEVEAKVIVLIYPSTYIIPLICAACFIAV